MVTRPNGLIASAIEFSKARKKAPNMQFAFWEEISKLTQTKTLDTDDIIACYNTCTEKYGTKPPKDDRR